jgi:plastocyanin
MNLKVRFWLLSLALVGAVILSACGGSSGGASGGAAALNIGSNGENLAFTSATLTAKAGAPVTVTFKNNSAAQTHTWVLVKGGDDVAANVDTAAVAGAGAVSAGGDVVATTKVVNGGGTETVNFTAPAAGTYTFLCTVPGHYQAGMKGTFTTN